MAHEVVPSNGDTLPDAFSVQYGEAGRRKAEECSDCFWLVGSAGPEKRTRVSPCNFAALVGPFCAFIP